MGSEDLLDIQEAARPVMGFCEAVLPLRNFVNEAESIGGNKGSYKSKVTANRPIEYEFTVPECVPKATLVIGPL